MKKILLSMGFIGLMSSQSFAAVFECSATEKGSDLQILVAMNDSRSEGMVFDRSSGKYQLVNGETSFVWAPDGGPTTVVVNVDQDAVDWKKNRDRCHVTGYPNYHLTIHREKSRLIFEPVFIKNPKVKGECAVPRPLVRPIAMSCVAL